MSQPEHLSPGSSADYDKGWAAGWAARSDAAKDDSARPDGYLLGYADGWNDAKGGRQYGEGRSA